MNANRAQKNHVSTGVVRSMCLPMLIGFLFSTGGRANNISLSNISTTGQDTVAKTMLVQFDLAWENSWRTATNHDAAWLFVKFHHPETTGDWAHATLSINAGDHTAPAGATVVPAADGTGVFIHRSANGSGDVNFTGVQLQWNYGSVTDFENVAVNVQVFAIEMVYVAQGAFGAGSGGSEIAAFTLTTINTADATTAGGVPTGQAVPDNASWPNGFNAFYCMKYEISQEQYTTFLNTLTRDQQNVRTESNVSRDTITNIFVMSNTPSVSRRNTITAPVAGNGTTAPITFTTLTPDRACNWLSWADGVAYADWSGLRPMTELEFEKACRARKAPVPNEYAWGTTDIHASAYALSNDGTPNAQISNMGTRTGNVSYFTTDGSINGPLRCGIFAASAVTPDWVSTGRSATGAMELSGNLWERPVTIGNQSGLAFTGNHGDGDLNVVGSANVGGWPADNASGAGSRGGNWFFSAVALRVSDRSLALVAIADRGDGFGFRCVRSGPAL